MTKPKRGSGSEQVKPPIRAGRPTAANAGEVDARLLDAATKLFLKDGFEATSCDQVVTLAGAGKGTLYARYANKEELFAAVVRRIADRRLAHSADDTVNRPLAERLQLVGVDILNQALEPDALAMTRLLITTATRSPELAQLADQIGWNQSVERVAQVISARAGKHELARAKAAAAWFLSLTLAPHQMRALLGESRHSLRKSALARVDEAVKMLSRSGWLDEWE